MHDHEAKNQFAPKLLAHEKIPGDWEFVLMEYVEIEPISKMDVSEKEKSIRSNT